MSGPILTAIFVRPITVCLLILSANLSAIDVHLGPQQRVPTSTVGLKLDQTSEQRPQDCASRELCQIYWGAGAVFIGKVIAIKPVSKTRSPQNARWPNIRSKVLFQIEKKYSGVSETENQVEIENLIDEKGRSYGFVLGQRYLVSAGERGLGMHPGLVRHRYVEACSQTKPVEQAIEEIKFLEEQTIKYSDWGSSLGAFRGGLLQGKAISLPTPSYPPFAKQAKIAGPVYVMLVIDEQGQPIKVEAVCGHPLLKPAAEEAALKVRYTPTLLSGRPVKVSGVIVYNFVSK